MATVYKVLGQSALAATTATAVYTVPASTEAIISTITICNRDSESHTFRLAIAANEASLDNKEYIAYDVVLAANDAICLTLGFTLPAAKKVVAYADAAQITVNVFGAEITA